jgi:hypothetical protein
MHIRFHFPQNPKSLYQRLNNEAQRLHKEARSTQRALNESDRSGRHDRQKQRLTWTRGFPLQAFGRRCDGQISRLYPDERETPGARAL